MHVAGDSGAYLRMQRLLAQLRSHGRDHHRVTMADVEDAKSIESSRVR